MTAEELDRVLCRELCGEASECSGVHYAFKEERRAALTLARSEGRREGLEEAAQHFELNDYPNPALGKAIAHDIRALAALPLPVVPAREE